MAHIEYLNSVCNLGNRKIVDVGAGDGTFAREMCEAGGAVTGIEIDPAKVERARGNLPADARMLEGTAQQLPIEAGSVDLVCFFFSFHHVPMDVQDQALNEVVRVLKPGGRLHVVEPQPFGGMFDAVKLVEDETEVRTNSHAIMNGLGSKGQFKLLEQKEYVLTRQYANFEAFLDRMIRTDPARLAQLPDVRDEMERIFHSNAPDADGVPVNRPALCRLSFWYGRLNLRCHAITRRICPTVELTIYNADAVHGWRHMAEGVALGRVATRLEFAFS